MTTRILVMLATALLIGFGSTYLVVGPGDRISSLRTGPWYGWQNLGTREADPYTVSRQVQSGQLALGANEGIALFAEEDSSGFPLVGSCNYFVDGQTPPALLWTLTAYDSYDSSSLQWTGVHSIDSRKIVRREDGSFRIAVSSSARPGNWLETNSTETMILVMRLYATQLAKGTNQAGYIMPKIIRGDCQ